jgi:hypothetical protein
MEPLVTQFSPSCYYFLLAFQRVRSRSCNLLHFSTPLFTSCVRGCYCSPISKVGVLPLVSYPQLKFASTFHIWRLAAQSAPWGRSMPRWQGVHLRRDLISLELKLYRHRVTICPRNCVRLVMMSLIRKDIWGMLSAQTSRVADSVCCEFTNIAKFLSPTNVSQIE